MKKKYNLVSTGKTDRVPITDDTDRYICVWHKRDLMDPNDIAHLMDIPLTEVLTRLVRCQRDGRYERYNRQLTEFGRTPINWKRNRKEKGDEYLAEVFKRYQDDAEGSEEELVKVLKPNEPVKRRARKTKRADQRTEV